MGATGWNQVPEFATSLISCCHNKIFRDEYMSVHALLRYTIQLSCLSSLLIFSGPAFAGTPGCSVHQSKPGVTQDTAGQMAHVDPATGELVTESLDPPGDAPVMRAEVVREPLKQEIRPDGTVVADIRGRFNTVLVAEVVDGKLVTCHQPLEQSEQPASSTGMDQGQ